MDRPVETKGGPTTLGKKEARDLARGFCAALFVSLPLLYTEEMWARALQLPNWALLGWVVLGYLASWGYVFFSGFRQDERGPQAALDAVTAMGIGALASLVTLLLIGRYEVTDDVGVIIRIVLLEMVPTAIGASVAINQLGGSGNGDSSDESSELHPDLRMILATALGALLFAFNLAPTVETQVIVYSISWWEILAIAVFSLGVSYLTVFVAKFARSNDDGRLITSRWVETVIAYVVSLVVSYLLLVMFGYIQVGIPFALQLAWVVILGYGTTLGGAAGRLVL